MDEAAWLKSAHCCPNVAGLAPQLARLWVVLSKHVNGELASAHSLYFAYFILSSMSIYFVTWTQNLSKRLYGRKGVETAPMLMYQK